MKHLKHALLSLLLLCLTAPAFAQDEGEAAPAQDEEQVTPTFFVTAHKCDMGELEAVIANDRERAMPILQALVDEGMLMSAGEAVHHWGDEYNLLTWMSGPDIPSTLEAWEAMNARYAEAHPDDSLYIETCPVHQDNIYEQQVFVASDAPPMIEEGNEPTLAVSFYTCDYTELGSLIEDYNERQRPITQALVEEGMLASEGIYTHAWGDEWNFVLTRAAADVPSLLDALDEGAARFQATHGEETQSPVEEHCSAHKDNIYTMMMLTN